MIGALHCFSAALCCRPVPQQLAICRAATHGRDQGRPTPHTHARHFVVKLIEKQKSKVANYQNDQNKQFPTRNQQAWRFLVHMCVDFAFILFTRHEGMKRKSSGPGNNLRRTINKRLVLHDSLPLPTQKYEIRSCLWVQIAGSSSLVSHPNDPQEHLVYMDIASIVRLESVSHRTGHAALTCADERTPCASP